MKYKPVCRKDYHSDQHFEDELNRLIVIGYEMYGQPFPTTQYNSLTQVMIKELEEVK